MSGSVFTVSSPASRSLRATSKTAARSQCTGERAVHRFWAISHLLYCIERLLANGLRVRH